MRQQGANKGANNHTTTNVKKGANMGDNKGANKTLHSSPNPEVVPDNDRNPLGVADKNNRPIYVNDEVVYESTPNTSGGRGLAASLTKGKDPFLRIFPVFHRSTNHTQTHIKPTQKIEGPKGALAGWFVDADLA